MDHDCTGHSEQKIAKIDVAKEVLSGVMGLLNPEDRFAIQLL